MSEPPGVTTDDDAPERPELADWHEMTWRQAEQAARWLMVTDPEYVADVTELLDAMTTPATGIDRYPDARDLQALADGDIGLAHYVRCGQPGCLSPIPAAKNRNARYCEQCARKRKAVQTAESRARARLPQPECCQQATKAAGSRRRITCPQHQEATAKASWLRLFSPAEVSELAAAFPDSGFMMSAGNASGPRLRDEYDMPNRGPYEGRTRPAVCHADPFHDPACSGWYETHRGWTNE
jgi:hypothetical protein